jgi:predicted dehydrogenase
MTERDVAAAIVGTGFMARVHAESLARIGIPVLGVVGSSPERAHSQAIAAGLPDPYDSLADVLDDSRVDAVHICSPNHLHHEHALAALRAGKHVICEKPLAMTSMQARELRDAARVSNLVHAVCFMSRFYPLCQEAAARVDSGSVGSVRLITGTYLQDWLAKDTDWNWRIDPQFGGSLRAVGDIGSHWLDLVSFISGQRVEAVMADLATVIPTRERPLDPPATFAQSSTTRTEPTAVTTEDMAGILLRFERGTRGILTLSQVSPGRKNHLTFEVSGSTASLGWGSENPEQLWVGRRDEPNQIQLRGGSVAGGPAIAPGDYPPGHAQGYPDTFKAMHRAIYTDIATGKVAESQDYPTFDDGLEQVLIGEAIADSALHGRWVAVQR